MIASLSCNDRSIGHTNAHRSLDSLNKTINNNNKTTNRITLSILRIHQLLWRKWKHAVFTLPYAQVQGCIAEISTASRITKRKKEVHQIVFTRFLRLTCCAVNKEKKKSNELWLKSRSRCILYRRTANYAVTIFCDPLLLVCIILRYV